jgi:hypothetical protein
MAAPNESIFNDLKEIIVEQLAVDPEEVTIEASFVEDLNADSLDLVELIIDGSRCRSGVVGPGLIRLPAGREVTKLRDSGTGWKAGPQRVTVPYAKLRSATLSQWKLGFKSLCV